MLKLKSSRSLVVALATLAVIVVWLVAIFIPSRHTLKARRVEIASLENDLSQLHTLFKSAGQSTSLSQNAKAETAQALSQLAREDSLEQFIDRLTETLSGFGLKEISVAPAVEVVLASRKVMVGDQQLAEILLHTTLTGRYLQIGKAIEYIEQQPYFSEFRLAGIGFDDELSPAVACQFDLTIYVRSGGVAQ